MADLARRSDKAPPPRSKVVLVREPSRQVRRLEEPDRLPMQLAIGVIVALGVVGLVWMIGHIGFRRGFAPIVRVPELLGDPGGGLVTGTMMLISVPMMVVRAGMAEPIWLMLGFVMIAIPGGALAAARPRPRGAPAPSSLTVVMSSIGTVFAGLNAIGIIWWTVSSFRNTRLGDLPFTADEVEAWQRGIETVAGLDVLAMIAATLWVVLTLRLAIPMWLRALTASATMFTLIIALVAMSLSNAAAAHIQSPRSVCIIDDVGFQPRLLLGTTGGQVASLHMDGEVVAVELIAPPGLMTVIDRRSIVEMLREGVEGR